MVGPRSLGVCLLTAAFVGMVFTIQFIRWVGGWVLLPGAFVDRVLPLLPSWGWGQG
jgi:hypothetical protein